MRNTWQRGAARIVLITPFVAFLSPSVALASQIALGSAVSFAVLGGSTITNTGITTIEGDLGVWPGSAYTGGETVTQTGTVYLADANGVAKTAEGDAEAAYDALAGLPADRVPVETDLGGLTLFPGVYSFASSVGLTGTLTLDANHDPNALFVFQIGTTLTTASSSAVRVIDGGAGNGVFWQVGSSATLGTDTAFLGNILAYSSITLDTGTTICGRALAQDGAVTMDTNTVSDACSLPSTFNGALGDFGSLGFAGDAVPEPGTVPLLSVGLVALTICGQSRKRVA
jgi:type VI secretion system secreted protein VgrG